MSKSLSEDDPVVLFGARCELQPRQPVVDNLLCEIGQRKGADVVADPSEPLALRFHALALALQQISAEFGNERDAYHLGLHHLELAEKPDPAAAIRWFTYAAELGHVSAAETLCELYTTGAPGIPADPQAVARWSAFGETTMAENFKPRSPLR